MNKIVDVLVLTLRRSTSGAESIREIGGLRFIAIFAVFLTHVYGVVYRGWGDVTSLSGGLVHDILSTAGRGVELFFIISGFILTIPFAKTALSRR